MRFFILSALVALTACGGATAPEGGSSSQAAVSTRSGVEAEVEAAVRKHLSSRSDLDMSAMDLTIQDVDVQGEAAVASVGFEVKGKPESAMSMQYSLAKEGGEWIVQAKPAGGHGGMPPQTAPSQGLPPGHPPAGGGGQPSQELPPSHPPVAQ